MLRFTFTSRKLATAQIFPFLLRHKKGVELSLFVFIHTKLLLSPFFLSVLYARWWAPAFRWGDGLGTFAIWRISMAALRSNGNSKTFSTVIVSLSELTLLIFHNKLFFGLCALWVGSDCFAFCDPQRVLEGLKGNFKFDFWEDLGWNFYLHLSDLVTRASFLSTQNFWNFPFPSFAKSFPLLCWLNQLFSLFQFKLNFSICQ